MSSFILTSTQIVLSVSAQFNILKYKWDEYYLFIYP